MRRQVGQRLGRAGGMQPVLIGGGERAQRREELRHQQQHHQRRRCGSPACPRATPARNAAPTPPAPARRRGPAPTDDRNATRSTRMVRTRNSSAASASDRASSSARPCITMVAMPRTRSRKRDCSRAIARNCCREAAAAPMPRQRHRRRHEQPGHGQDRSGAAIESITRPPAPPAAVPRAPAPRRGASGRTTRPAPRSDRRRWRSARRNVALAQQRAGVQQTGAACPCGAGGARRPRRRRPTGPRHSRPRREAEPGSRNPARLGTTADAGQHVGRAKRLRDGEGGSEQAQQDDGTRRTPSRALFASDPGAGS